MRLYIIRHGETEWNKELRLQGRSDIKLNEYGIELAEITSEALKDLSFDVIYSSPLIRAYQTADIIRRDRKVDIIKDERLIEMSFGDFEGMKTKDLPEEFHNFFDAPQDYSATPNGETFLDVIARAEDFVKNVVIPKAKEIDSMLIVAHGAFINGLNSYILKRELKDYWAGIFPRNCAVTSYDVTGDYFDLVSYCDIFYKYQGGKSYK